MAALCSLTLVSNLPSLLHMYFWAACLGLSSGGGLAREVAPVRRLTVSEDWSPCEFLRELANHEPFVLPKSVPPDLQEILTPERLSADVGEEVVGLSVSENGFFGPHNDDHEAMMSVTMNTALRLLGLNSSHPHSDDDLAAAARNRKGLELYAWQSVLPGKLRASVEAALPDWMPFRPQQVNLWLDGPESYHWQGLHYDPSHNVYLQVSGVKKFQLIPPWQGYLVPMWTAAYTAVTEHWRSNVSRSQVLRAWEDMSAGPLAEATMLSAASRFSVSLNPGDILVLPRNWWHTVMNNGGAHSLSISTWFNIPSPILEGWWEFRNTVFERSTAIWRRQMNIGKAAQKTIKERTAKSRHTAERLIRELAKQHVWFNSESIVASQWPEEGTMPEKAMHVTQGKCIRWSISDLATIKKALESHVALSSLRIEGLLQWLGSPIGQGETAWEGLGKISLELLGGSSWQTSGSWRNASFYTMMYRDEVMDREMDQRGLALRLPSKGKNFFQWFRGCDVADIETPVSDQLSGVHPVCENAYRVALQILNHCLKCEIRECDNEFTEL